MISKTELAKYCAVRGLNLWQVEKDYLQYLALTFLSENGEANLIFKGGTALNKAYGLNRFSIDLDFTDTGNGSISPAMGKIARNINDFGYPTELKELKTIGKTYVLKIKGPLYENSPVSVSSLRIEISQRETVLLEPNLKEILPVYQDLRPYIIKVMNEAEILAEKVRAIMTRNRPRDAFDLQFLIRRNVKFDTDLINKKLTYYEKKYDAKKFVEQLKKLQHAWEKELKSYVNNLPSFESVFTEITKCVDEQTRNE